MRFFLKIKRALRRLRTTDKLSVYTRNHLGEVFHYDLRLCPACNRAGTRQKMLVRFDRTGPQGNICRQYRVMTPAQALRLRLAAC